MKAINQTISNTIIDESAVIHRTKLSDPLLESKYNRNPTRRNPIAAKPKVVISLSSPHLLFSCFPVKNDRLAGEGPNCGNARKKKQKNYCVKSHAVYV
jgi:hypothetical protein